MLNKVTLIGNLGADPETRYTSNGTAVCNFRVATNEVWNDKDGNRQTRAEWHYIVTWARLAEVCGEYLSKGRQVFLEGKIRTRKWEDRDGNTRYTTEIHADDVKFLGSKRGAEIGAAAVDQLKEQELPSVSDDSKELFGGKEEVPVAVISDDDVPF